MKTAPPINGAGGFLTTALVNRLLWVKVEGRANAPCLALDLHIALCFVERRAKRRLCCWLVLADIEVDLVG